jgi:hypothetical protein
MNIILSPFANIFSVMSGSFSAVLDVWFIVFPPLFFFLFEILWEHHVQGSYASKLKWVLLEIIPPRDSEKSPRLVLRKNGSRVNLQPIFHWR